MCAHESREGNVVPIWAEMVADHSEYFEIIPNELKPFSNT